VSANARKPGPLSSTQIRGRRCTAFSGGGSRVPAADGRIDRTARFPLSSSSHPARTSQAEEDVEVEVGRRAGKRPDLGGDRVDGWHRARRPQIRERAQEAERLPRLNENGKQASRRTRFPSIRNST
jgi:hypothetical protein